MLIRIFLIIGLIITCYSFPSNYENQFLELANLRENCFRSLILGVVIMLLCREKVAIAVIGVEFVLSLCNFYVALNWAEYGGIFNGHYSQLQLGAYLLEIAIMLSWLIFGAAEIGRDESDSNYNWLMLSRFIPDRRRVHH